MDSRGPLPDPQNAPLLSVITVVRNGAATIERTLQSVIAQKTPAIEYLVLDGASTDETLHHIKHYANDIDYWHSKPDAGIAAAFNAGLELARGQYLSFLNADDWYAPGALSTVQAVLQEDPSIKWLCGAINYSDPWSDFQRVELAEPKNLSRYMSVYHPSMVIERATHQRVGLYNENLDYAMDSEWTHRALKSGVSPKILPTVIANMTLGGTSNQHLARALAEYRTSVLANELCGPAKANYYFVRQWLVHTALKSGWVRALLKSRAPGGSNS